MEQAAPKAIIYSSLMELRFSDFDPYSHLTSSNYVDLVLCSRTEYQSRHFGISPEYFVKRNLGFYLVRFEIDFKRPVTLEYNRLTIRSWVTDASTPRIEAKFEILDEAAKIHFASGTFYFVPINLETKRPQAIPDWVHKFVFEEPAETK